MPAETTAFGSFLFFFKGGCSNRPDQGAAAAAAVDFSKKTEFAQSGKSDRSMCDGLRR